MITFSSSTILFCADIQNVVALQNSAEQISLQDSLRVLTPDEELDRLKVRMCKGWLECGGFLAVLCLMKKSCVPSKALL